MYIEKTKAVLDRVYNTLLNKSYDYGEGIFSEDVFNNPPDRAVLVRIGDKLRRLANLASDPNEPPAVDESLSDTVLDLIGYLAIYKVILDNRQ